MKPRLILASTALALATFAGSAQANLVKDLSTMTAEQALNKALQGETRSIEALITSAAGQLQGQPELLSSLISAAVKVLPEQAAQIVSVAITHAPALAGVIVNAALAATEGNPALQAAITQAATDEIAHLEQTAADPSETEAEQTEAPADTPAAIPPPPVVPPGRGSDDKPPSVSPN